MRSAGPLRVAMFGTTATITAMLGGCATSPPERPTTPFVLPAAFSAHQSGMNVAGDRWWEDFGDPRLDQFVDTALEGNPGIAQAVARTRIAEAQARISRADQLPQAGLRAGGVRQRQTITGLP